MRAGACSLARTKDDLAMSYDKVAVLESDIKNQKGNIEDLKIQIDQLIEERNRFGMIRFAR